MAFAGTFGYRFSRVFGMEIEATVVPDFKAPFSNDFPVILNSSAASNSAAGFTSLIFPGPVCNDAGGRLVIFTTNARVEIPTVSARASRTSSPAAELPARGAPPNLYSYPIPFLLRATQVSRRCRHARSVSP